jgi:hypothetical protein
MRIPFLLTAALAPAALVAQAPAPAKLNFTQMHKAEAPAIEQLIKDFKPAEAMKKAESLLPAAKPAFDTSNLNASRACSIQFSDLARIYHLAGKSAIAAGYWEKGRDYFLKAQEVAKENHEAIKAAIAPTLEAWKAPVAAARKALEEGGARFKELSAKQPLTPEEEQELKNFQIHQQNIANGEKLNRILQKDADDTRKEADAFQPMIDAAQKAIKDEADEVDKGAKQAQFKGNKEKYFSAILNADNLKNRATKADKLNFLFRVRFHAEGTPLAEKVDSVIDRVRQDQDPFPPAPKAGKAGKGGRRKAK